MCKGAYVGGAVARVVEAESPREPDSPVPPLLEAPPTSEDDEVRIRSHRSNINFSVCPR